MGSSTLSHGQLVGLACILELCVFDYAAESLQQLTYAPYCMNVTIPSGPLPRPRRADAHWRTSQQCH